MGVITGCWQNNESLNHVNSSICFDETTAYTAACASVLYSPRYRFGIAFNLMSLFA